MTTENPSEPTILTREENRVGIITLNRPNALNALCSTLIQHLLRQLHAYDANPNIGAIVITGNSKAFSAGADIKEQRALDFVTAYTTDYLRNLQDGFASIHKPVIAAVNGYALGGGCELALMCDIVYAGQDAFFGQPEIKLGIIPGAGGTQRLIRAVGKAMAMHMILTGEIITAQEAADAGLVAKLFAPKETVSNAIAYAQTIAGFSAPVLAMAKEAVNAAEDSGLKTGLRFESRLYHATFGLADHAEGFDAFLQKREPRWEHK